jgi:ribonucleoside-diphosphate reductase alpha chain
MSVLAPVKPAAVTYKEALAATIEYFDGDALAAEVWVKKYALKDSSGTIYERTPDDMHRRIASEFARMEARYPNPVSEEEIYQALAHFRYLIPQGSPMAGIGNTFQVASLSNCFVIGHDQHADSYGLILRMDEELVQLMKRRGGVGVDLSNIRPKGSPVQNTALTASGIVPFMERYSNSTREVAQDGRRGALMLTLNIRHPEADAFIDAKLDTSKVTGANISVKIDDAFMEAARSGTDYTTRYPVSGPEIKVTKTVKAREIWDKLIHNAWKSAEPGILFWDTIQRESVPDCYADLGFETVSTNPCGEIPLCPYDSCRLLAVNLAGFVTENRDGKETFDEPRFVQTVRLAQRLMDDLVDLELEKVEQILAKIEKDPEDEVLKRNERELWLKIREKCVNGRRTGLGITGLGDLLAGLGLRYGSREANEKAESIQKLLAVTAYRSSVEMAEERGAFPMFDAAREAKNPFINRLAEADPELGEKLRTTGRRNVSLLTIAPTGTTSLMSQTTSGIEPVFSLFYYRRRKIDASNGEKADFIDDNGDAYKEYPVLHHGFRHWLNTQGFADADIDKMKTEQMQLWADRSPYAGSVSAEIDYLSKVDLQARLQKWVDHSISVTINVPAETPESTVSELFMSAWEKGCKGITIYRDGSRAGILVTKPAAEPAKAPATPKRPKELEAAVLQFMNEEEPWVAVVGLMDGRPYEIFTGRAEDSFRVLSYVSKGKVIKTKDDHGKNRYDFQYMDRDGYKITIEGLSRTFSKEYWNYARLISGVMRHGMPLTDVIEMIGDLHLADRSLNTWKNGVIRGLSKFIPDGTQPAHNECPNCHENTVTYQEGCLVCTSCGHSKCG